MVSDAEVVTAEIDTEGRAFTKAKLFVWNNTTDIVPQVVSRSFTK